MKEEERQQREETQKEEEECKEDGEEENMAQQPQELQHQDLVLHPSTAKDPMEALHLLHLELSSLNAKDTRVLRRLKCRIL